MIVFALSFLKFLSQFCENLLVTAMVVKLVTNLKIINWHHLQARFNRGASIDWSEDRNCHDGNE
jgi:hypothetical protein